jgi:uncharacterized protein YyaL (SSP411 family)
VDEANARLAAPAGGWRNVADDLTARVEIFDTEEPSGNALMAEAVLRVAALTAKPVLYTLAEKTLAAYAEQARASGLGMSAWLDASLLADGPFYDVVIVGDTKLSDAWRALVPPWAVHADLAAPLADGDPLLALAPSLASKRGPAAYVCVRGACRLPSRDTSSFREQLLAGWTK